MGGEDMYEDGQYGSVKLYADSVFELLRVNATMKLIKKFIS